MRIDEIVMMMMMMMKMMWMLCCFALQEDHYDSSEDVHGVAVIMSYHGVERGDHGGGVVCSFVMMW